jgi:proline iminopeptidase
MPPSADAHRLTDEGWLPEIDGHRLHWARRGDPAAPVLLALPTGPGTELPEAAMDVFAGAGWQVLTLHPRGCGRSTWRELLHANTTDHQAHDLERLRRSAGIERWTVFGCLWGSVLALRYAQAHPDRVAALVLNSVYLGEHAEVHWFFGGAGAMVPQTWEPVLELVPVPPGADIATTWARWLASAPEADRALFCRRLMAYDLAIVRHRPGREVVLDAPEDPDDARFFAIFLHVLSNRFFMPDEAIVQGIDRIRHLPCHIVQGRFDLASGIRPAWRLAKAWPQATWTLVEGAGCGYLHEPAQSAVLQALAAVRDVPSARA